ncbi:MAG: response regulator [Candidatus Hydrogenedentes bacterium]|nr:response regulator [Candidatus Hydrogenedentota bacterium]
MCEPQSRAAVILLVDDDPEDQELTKRALRASKLRNVLMTVDDGEEALDYLYRRGAYAAAKSSPRPDLILLDLNMPKVDGRAVLSQIKSDPSLRRIPVVILTTSSQEEDILRSYDLGVNSYVTKPVRMEGFIRAIQDLEHYWFDLVVLPNSSV